MGRIKGSINETAAILKDWRMQFIGGMIGAWDIWEMSIIPSLLANCCTWVQISQKVIDTLDGLQNLYCSLVYACPGSMPKPAFRGEAGLLDMSYRICVKKVCLVSRVMFSSEEQCYAREILKEQLDMGWRTPDWNSDGGPACPTTGAA